VANEKQTRFQVKDLLAVGKKILTHEQLCAAAKEILAGQYEADLGAGVCKKRIAMSGQGKRGATRTLVANTSAHGVFFMAGRTKSDPGTDFSDASVAQAQLIAKDLQASTILQIEDAMQDRYIEEICHDCKEKS
jgi:hypothetical protein